MKRRRSQRMMRQPTLMKVYKRWVVCLYDYSTKYYYSGWTMRHACGKYDKLDLRILDRYKDHNIDFIYNMVIWPEDVLRLINKIPVVFGNQIRKKKFRHPQGVCPRCKEKVPGGLAIWVTTRAMVKELE